MHLPVQPLTAEAFAPFGKLVELPDRPEDGAGPGWKWWGENALLAGDGRPFGVGYLDLQPAELTFDWAERHMHSMEMLVPVHCDCLVYVGPADYPDEPGRLPPLESFQVFRVRPGQAVLLEKGVWHGAPLAVDRPANVVVLLHQGTGSGDLSLVRFSETPVHIQVG